MPKVAYSDEDKERIRKQLVEAGLELMAKQGIQHTVNVTLAKNPDQVKIEIGGEIEDWD